MLHGAIFHECCYCVWGLVVLPALARWNWVGCHWPSQGVNWKLTSRGARRESSLSLCVAHTSPERVWFMAARAERRITNCQMGPQSIPAHAIHSLWFSARCTLSRINWMRPGRRIKWRRIKVELPSSRGYTPTHTRCYQSGSESATYTQTHTRTKARLTTRHFLNAFILGWRISRIAATWYADCFGIWSFF